MTRVVSRMAASRSAVTAASSSILSSWPVRLFMQSSRASFSSPRSSVGLFQAPTPNGCAARRRRFQGVLGGLAGTFSAQAFRSAPRLSRFCTAARSFPMVMRHLRQRCADRRPGPRRRRGRACWKRGQAWRDVAPVAGRTVSSVQASRRTRRHGRIARCARCSWRRASSVTSQASTGSVHMGWIRPTPRVLSPRSPHGEVVEDELPDDFAQVLVVGGAFEVPDDGAFVGDEQVHFAGQQDLPGLATRPVMLIGTLNHLPCSYSYGRTVRQDGLQPDDQLGAEVADLSRSEASRQRTMLPSAFSSSSDRVHGLLTRVVVAGRNRFGGRSSQPA